MAKKDVVAFFQAALTHDGIRTAMANATTLDEVVMAGAAHGFWFSAAELEEVQARLQEARRAPSPSTEQPDPSGKEHEMADRPGSADE